VSVIVPAHNAAHLLERSLGALRDSRFPEEQWELIVVDDGSTDDTTAVASRYADDVVRLPGRPYGPAYARNRGFEASRGDIIFFFDADVVVRPDTICRVVEILAEYPDVGAVFGSYDDSPPAPGLMSQYRNLLHHYVHQQNSGDVETFWAGAGAIRRQVFADAGMYDEWHYSRPQIEDIELGTRIKRNGQRILLRPDIQVTHLKRWTLAGVIRTDLSDRGIPWARLLAHRRAVFSTRTLNLSGTEKIKTILVFAAVALVILAAVLRKGSLLVAALACLLTVVALSFRLWSFFARLRGPWFAIRVIPAHLLYYLLNGISFGVGLFLQQLVGPPLRDPITEAFAEVGAKRWPPVPSRDRPSSWTAEHPQSREKEVK
jgi:glycosyltransferase involved in cell wall biosynthesis